MKIAMIGHKRIPSREGGIEICVTELATRMAKEGHDVTVYNRNAKGFPKQKRYEGVRIVNTPTINTKSLDALIYSAFATLHALFCGYDVIHFHAVGPSAMVFLAKLFRRRVVCTVHGLNWHSDKWGGFAKKYLQFGEKMIAKKSDAAIVLSENMAEYFRATHGRQTVFIPNGVNKPTVRPANIITEKYGLKKGGYILFLARIAPGKGLDYLIDAYKTLNTDIKLAVCGGSSHTDEYLQSMKERAKEDARIIFTGFVGGEELDEFYSNAFLYILPSDSEGMPLSLLEALSYGNCCVVSDIPESTEVMAEHGFVHRKGDVQSIHDLLQHLLDNPQLVQQKAQGAAEYVLRRYNWDDVTQKTLGCYESVVKEKREV